MAHHNDPGFDRRLWNSFHRNRHIRRHHCHHRHLLELWICMLEEQIELARDFHQQGGNLKSIQLCSFIQKALDRLGVEFIPKEEEDPNSSLPTIPEKFESDPTGTTKRRLTRTIHNDAHGTLGIQPTKCNRHQEGRHHVIATAPWWHASY
jgi:hypothetical protein